MSDEQPSYGSYPPANNLPEHNAGTSITQPPAAEPVPFTPPAGRQPQKKKPVAVIVAVVALVAALAVGAYLAFRPSSSTAATPAAAATTKAKTKLETVVDKCYPISARTQDLGHTLTLSNVDAKENPGPDDMDTLACVLRGLDTPSSVIDHMSTTRAMDGQQTDSWNGMNARWTYHPDHGMNLTLTDNK